MWGKEWSKTLHWRLIWPSIAINLIAIAVTAWLARYALNSILLHSSKARAEIVCHAVNYAAESASRRVDLQRFVYSIGAEQDINLIVVAGNHLPRVLACTRNEFNDAPLAQLPWPEAIPALAMALRDGKTVTTELAATGEFQIASPLLLSDFQQTDLELRPGAVLVRLDQAPIREGATRIIWMGASLFILLLIVTNALIIFLIQRRVLHPLQLINGTLRRRSAGDTAARAPIVTKDEIGTVAGVMNAVFDRREELESEAVSRAEALTNTNRLLRESEERFRIAAESATDLVYELNIQTGEIVWNRDLGEALGYAPGEFPSTLEAWTSVIAPEDRPRAVTALERHVEAGEPFDVEYRMIGKDGEARYWRDRGRALRDSDGRPLRMIGVMTNVTAERIASRQLYSAKEAAENANRAKDDFLAALSHELRTPLSPVLMLAGEMERSPEVPPDIREGFALIRHNVELEARLIDDLLDLTRITRGKFHLDRKPLDLYAVIDKAIDTVRSTIEARGLSMHVDLSAPDRKVDADPVRLQQVFWNVLKNAAKFTSPGGRIMIHSRNPDRGTIQISIIDTGLGIAEENLERIFHAFEQVQHPAAHRFGGLGLGLAISRKLIEAHGGKIWAESRGLGQGTTFQITLPLIFAGAAELEPQKPSPAPAAGPVPLRILLVEDHDETRAILERLLKRRGHEVFAAADVATAQNLGSQNDCGLVISDIGLPDGNGYDLMIELRKMHPHLLGIALSGFGMEQDVRRSREAGFFAHLTKPVDMQALDRVINDARQRETENG